MKKIITARTNTAGRIAGAAVTAALFLTAPIIATMVAGSASADVPKINLSPSVPVKYATPVSDMNSHIVGHLTAGENVMVGRDCTSTDFCLIFGDLGGGRYGKGYVYGDSLNLDKLNH